MWRFLTFSIRRLINSRRWERELREELAFHHEHKRQELSRQGLCGDALNRATAVALGNITRAREDARGVWVPSWCDRLRGDARRTWRSLTRQKALSVTVVTILAVGIGFNTAVFTVVRAVLLRPLAFVQPDRMLWLATLEERGHDEFVTSHDFVAWQAAQSLANLVAYDVFSGRFVVQGVDAQSRIATVTADFWKVTGARTERGRLPEPDASEAVLSWESFEQRFAGDDAIIGTPVVIGGRSATIVGVLPPGFHTDLVQTPTWSGATPRAIDVYHGISVHADPSGAIQLFRVFGQRAAGFSIENVRSELATIRAAAALTNPNASFRPTLVVVPYQERFLGRPRSDLQVLFGAVALVLLIGCANIASLLIARATVRQKELAIRTAIGAGRVALISPIIIESLVLSSLGGLVGLVVAQWCLGIVKRLVPSALPRLMQASIDGSVFIFVVVASVTTAVLFNIGPALVLGRTNAYEVLRDGTGTESTGRQSAWLKRWLVAGEIAIAVVLASSAGLLIRSLMVLQTYPAGFLPARTLSLSVAYDAGGLSGGETRPSTYITEVLRRTQELPQVDIVGMTTNSSGRLPIIIEGAPAQRLTRRKTALLSSVSEGYASTIGMRVVEGRWITDHESAPVCVVNEQLAARDFPDRSPIGRRIQTGGPPGASGPDVRFATIVGIVKDLRYAKLETPPEPEVFADFRHTSPFSITFVARISGDASAVGQLLRREIARVDPTQVVSQPVTVAKLLNDSISPRRFTVIVLTVFGAVAVFLAAVGIYGLLSYTVAAQTREIGIRLALGATRSDIARLVVGRTAGLLSLGLLVGIPAAVLSTHTFTSLLYGVAPTDPIAFAGALVVLAGAAMAACVVPALKAAAVQPAIALRCG